jgi:hypothetical protein
MEVTMRVITLSRSVAALGVLTLSVACNGDSLTPTPPPPSEAGMTLVPRNATIHAGQVVTLQARLVDEFGDALESSISWKSSNDAIATVAATGTVYGRSEGLAVITASANGKGQFSTVRVLRREEKPEGKDPRAPAP